MTRFIDINSNSNSNSGVHRTGATVPDLMCNVEFRAVRERNTETQFNKSPTQPVVSER